MQKIAVNGEHIPSGFIFVVDQAREKLNSRMENNHARISIFVQTQEGASAQTHPHPFYFSQVGSSSSTDRGFTYLHITKGVRVRVSDQERAWSWRTRVGGFAASRFRAKDKKTRYTLLQGPKEQTKYPADCMMVLEFCSTNYF